VVTVLVMPMGVTAANSASQSASTSQSTTISIRNIGDTTDVTTITFPSGAPGTSITNPTGNGDTQNLTSTGTEASPVAILTSNTQYTIWYSVTDTSSWDATVASERLYTIAINGSLTLDNFNTNATQITSWGTASNSSQTVGPTGTAKELYLGVTLESVSGKSGTSTLTILGES